MNLMKIIAIALFSVLLTSCGSLLGIREERSFKVAPNNSNMRFNTSMSDLKYLGDVTGTLTYTEYLGFIKIYNNNTTKKSYLYVNGYSLNSWTSRILYDNMGQYEDAELIMPIVVQENSMKMILGRKVTTTVKAKVYKFK